MSETVAAAAAPAGWTRRIAEWGGYARQRGGLPLLLHWVVWGLPYLLLLLGGKIASGSVVLWRGLLGLPAWISDALDTSAEILTTQKGRRALLRAIVDERALNENSRRAMIFLAFLFLFIGYIIVEILTFTTFPEVRAYKNQTDLLLFYGIATRLALPTPYEVVLLPAAKILGNVTAVMIASFSAVIASWLLFLLGTEANHGLEGWLTKRNWGRRFWRWLKKNARRYGYVLMGGLLAIPFTPDSLTAVFALLGLRLRPFLYTIFLSAIVRFSVFLWAAERALG